MQNLSLLLAVLLMQTFTHDFAHGQVHDTFNCFYDCGFSNFDVDDCASIIATLQCYDENFECASDDNAYDVLFDFYDAEDMCNGISSSSPIVPADFDCTSLQQPMAFVDPTVPMPQADLTREPHSCSVSTDQQRMRQCSMFSYSHLRSFKGYRNGIETCALPGEWYLLHHDDLSITVESQPLEGTNSTRLVKVEVIFPSSDCVTGTSYVAEYNSPLPTTFSNNLPVNNSNSALQLNHRGSVVTILATWLDATIIIRQFNDSLSVTTQVPGDTSFYSDGLCRGCPPHTFVNITTKNTEVGRNCPEYLDSITNCYLYADAINFEGIENETYLACCTYDDYLAKNIDTLSQIKAVTQDARLLEDGEAFVPIRRIIEPPTFPSMTTEPEQRNTEQQFTAGQTDDNDRYSSSQRIVSFSTLILLGLACLTIKLYS